MEFDLQNHYLKIQKREHYKTLVRQSKEYDEALAKSPRVDKDTVDQALTEKFKLARQLKEDIKGNV